MTKILVGKSNVDLDYPVCRPALDLDFTQEVLDERITFTRATSTVPATRVNKFGLIESVPANQPRFDYDPVTKQCKGLLLENGATNLLTYSNAFTNSVWNGSTVSRTDNVAVSPDGTTNAALISTGSGTFPGLLRQAYTFSAVPYTFSIFVKKINCRYIGLRIGFSTYEPNGTTIKYPFFDLDTETFSANSVSGVNFSYQKFPDGWYRLSLTYTPTAVTNVVDLALLPSDGNVYPAQGQGALSAYVYGAQLQSDGYLISYIPTTSSTVTKVGDVASISGTNFSSWYNQLEGTVITNYIMTVPSTTSSNHADFAILNADASNRIVGWSNDVKLALISVIKNNITVYLPINNAVGNTTNIPIKKAVSLRDKNMQTCVNGNLYTVGVLTQDYQQLLPNDFTYMYLGAEGIFASSVNGTLARFTYYPKALPPNQLQLLTA